MKNLPINERMTNREQIDDVAQNKNNTRLFPIKSSFTKS